MVTRLVVFARVEKASDSLRFNAFNHMASIAKLDFRCTKNFLPRIEYSRRSSIGPVLLSEIGSLPQMVGSTMLNFDRRGMAEDW